jgi:methyl-accepting chemotaxis protein
MVMHPFKPELDGKDLSQNTDPTGKRLFVEFVRVVKERGEGLVDYQWPKPGSSAPAPKVSYVKGFAPWGWVIGSGIYVDDVQARTASLASTLALVAAGVLAVLLAVAWGVSRSITGPLCLTVKALREMGEGEGDLRRRLELRGKDEVAELAGAFNAFVERFAGLVRAAGTSTAAVSTAAESYRSETGESRDVNDLQRVETEQIAAAVTEMAATAGEVARSAASAASASERADGESRAGRARVDETLRAVGGLAADVGAAGETIARVEANTREIGAVLDVIRGVAEQTNLLALNAAIEAARAGEQGRGFAVVADEVRALASRTQHSTAEIQSMIAALQQGAQTAAQTMGRSQASAQATLDVARQAVQSLDAISEAVGTMRDMSTQIATAAEEQSVVAQDIDARLGRISELSARAAGATERAAQTAETLASQGAELSGLMARFKV